MPGFLPPREISGLRIRIVWQTEIIYGIGRRQWFCDNRPLRSTIA